MRRLGRCVLLLGWPRRSHVCWIGNGGRARGVCECVRGEKEDGGRLTLFLWGSLGDG